MKSQAHVFKDRAALATHDGTLRRALGRAKDGFVGKRRLAVEALPEFGEIRAAAKRIKDHTLDHLADYLEQFEAQVTAGGGKVHWAETPAEANSIVLELCRKAGARRIAKGKSMVAEETGLNETLEGASMEVLETDLGEYIIQLAKEPPSHIIAPAVHKNREQIRDLFRDHHPQLNPTRKLAEVSDLVNEARAVLRQGFLDADVGITGANFLIAESGSTVLVTNEGNGDLSSTLPRVHIVIAGIEKVVPTVEDACTLLRLLARSATGQEITAYTSFFCGPRRPGENDGPEQFHIVLVDNGRSGMWSGKFREMLRCIRCGACLNHCPVYGAIGGHAYGWVYPGPMGSVLTPLLLGLEEAGDLPNASSLCGRCEEVCPMSIPLPSLLRQHRIDMHARRIEARSASWGLALWGALVRQPRLYRLASAAGARVLRLLSRGSGNLRRLPLAGGWTAVRDLPAPEGNTFMGEWKKRGGQ